METLFDELKRYVGWTADDEAQLRALHAACAPHFDHIADVFYQRIHRTAGKIDRAQHAADEHVTSR